MPKEEIFISVDIEASGPVPGTYSMLSIGACLVDDPHQSFYQELKPLNTNAEPDALRVCKLNMATLEKTGEKPEIAMEHFRKWVLSVSRGGTPVLVAFNAPFDWMFLHYYFLTFVGNDPFGFSALDIKAYYMGMKNTSWAGTSKSRLDRRFALKNPLTHNALQDAIDQAELFRKMLLVNKPN